MIKVGFKKKGGTIWQRQTLVKVISLEGSVQNGKSWKRGNFHWYPELLGTEKGEDTVFC